MKRLNSQFPHSILRACGIITALKKQRRLNAQFRCSVLRACRIGSPLKIKSVTSLIHFYRIQARVSRSNMTRPSGNLAPATTPKGETMKRRFNLQFDYFILRACGIITALKKQRRLNAQFRCSALRAYPTGSPLKIKSQFEFSILIACGMLAALALCASLQATTLLRMSIAELARHAPLIVRARCLSSSVGWDAGEIWTFTNFATEEVWRGSASANITVRLLGGKTGNLTSTVSGIPRFQPGEEVVLFLETTRRGDYSVVSWEQGTFRIRRARASAEEIATQDTSSSTTFNPRTRRFETNGNGRFPVASLRSQIDAALNPSGSQP